MLVRWFPYPQRLFLIQQLFHKLRFLRNNQKPGKRMEEAQHLVTNTGGKKALKYPTDSVSDISC